MELKSEIILCNNIKVDKEYTNVLSFSESDMVQLCRNNRVVSADNYSFIRANGTIQTKFDYNTALQCTYIAFQNKDYSNKWFFAWIDDVIFKGDNNTEIKYTIDVWSTWFSKINFNESFVIREHVNDDTPGKNLIPENLETGEYKVISHLRDAFNRESPDPKPAESNYYVVVASTVDLYNDTPVFTAIYNGIPTGVKYFPFAMDWGDPEFPPLEDLRNVLYRLASQVGGKGLDAIQNMFIAPSWLVDGLPDTQTRLPKQKWTGVTPLSQLDGYTPKNKKLLQYPFCYFRVSNCQGQEAILKQEYWSKLDSQTTAPDGTVIPAGDMELVMYGSLTQGCSIRMFPPNYNNDGDPTDVGVNLGKFPQVCWNSDAFTNWLTENGVNIAMSGIGTVAGIASGNVAIASSSMLKGVDLMKSGIEASLTPPQVNGNTNNGDIMMAMDENCFHVFKMSIRYDFAKRIDDYFSRYGYKVNSIKVPNITGRQNFNYIQISDDSVIGYGEIPNKYMDEINNICKNGVTIWHNHQNIGNYNIENSILP